MNNSPLNDASELHYLREKRRWLKAEQRAFDADAAELLASGDTTFDEYRRLRKLALDEIAECEANIKALEEYGVDGGDLSYEQAVRVSRHARAVRTARSLPPAWLRLRPTACRGAQRRPAVARQRPRPRERRAVRRTRASARAGPSDEPGADPVTPARRAA